MGYSLPLDLWGVDVDAIYELGNMWIGMGDALTDHMNAMTGAVAGMNWSGITGNSMRFVWGAGAFPAANGFGPGNGSSQGITALLTSARDNCYQIGGAINYYADQIWAAAKKQQKEAIIEIIVGAIGVFLNFIPLGFIGKALEFVGEALSGLVSVLKEMGTIGKGLVTAGGFAGAAITGAAINTIIQFGLEGITHAAFGEGWKPTWQDAAMAAGAGAVFGAGFHGINEFGGSKSPKNVGDMPKGAVPNVKTPGNTPHIDPGMINGKNGAGATPPPKIDSSKFAATSETVTSGGFKPQTDLSHTNITKSTNDSFAPTGGAKDGVTNPSNVLANNDVFAANGGRNGSGRPNGTQPSANESFTGGDKRPSGPPGAEPVRSSNDPVTGNGNNTRNGSDPTTVTSGTNSFIAGGGKNGSGTKPGQTPADFAGRPGGTNERIVTDPSSVERGSQSASSGRGTSGVGPNTTRGGAGGGSKQTPLSPQEENGTRVPLTPDDNRPFVAENGSRPLGGNGRPTPGNERVAQGNGPNGNAGRPGERGPNRDGTSFEDSSEPPNIIPPGGKTEPPGPGGFGDSRTDSAIKGDPNPPSNGSRTNPARQDTKLTKNGSPVDGEPQTLASSSASSHGDSSPETVGLGKSSVDSATAKKFSSGGGSRSDVGQPGEHATTSGGGRGQSSDKVPAPADPSGNGRTSISGAGKDDPLSGRIDVDAARKTLDKQPAGKNARLWKKAEEIVKPLASRRPPEQWEWSKSSRTPHSADEIKTLVAAEIHKNGGPRSPEGVKAGRDLARDLTIGKPESSKPAVSPKTSRVDGRGGGVRGAARFNDRPQKPHEWPADGAGSKLGGDDHSTPFGPRENPRTAGVGPAQTRASEAHNGQSTPKNDPLAGRTDVDGARKTLGEQPPKVSGQLRGKADEIVKPLASQKAPEDWAWNKNAAKPHSADDIKTLVAAEIHKNGGPESPEGLKAGKDLARDLTVGKPEPSKPAVSPKTSRVDGRGGGVRGAARFNDRPQKPHEWPADGKGSKLGGDDHSTPFGPRENPRTAGAGPAQTRANEAHNGQSTPKNDPLDGRTDVDGARRTLGKRSTAEREKLWDKADGIVKPLASQKAPEDWAWNKNAAKPHSADDIKTLVAAEIHKNGGPESPEGLKAGKDLARDLTVGKPEPSKPAVSPKTSRVDGRGGGVRGAARFNDRPQKPHEWPADGKGSKLGGDDYSTPFGPRENPRTAGAGPAQTRANEAHNGQSTPKNDPLAGRTDVDGARKTLGEQPPKVSGQLRGKADEIVKPLASQKAPEDWVWNKNAAKPHSVDDIKTLVAAEIHKNGGPESPEGVKAGRDLARDLTVGKPAPSKPAVSPKTSRVDGRGGGASKAAKFNDDKPQQPHEWPADGKGSKLGGDDYSTPFGPRENPRTAGAGPAQTRANEAHNGQSTPKNDPLDGRTDVDSARGTLGKRSAAEHEKLWDKADGIVKPLASQKAPEDWAWNKNAAKPHSADDIKTLVAAEIHKNGGPESPEGLKAGKDLARDLTVGKPEPSKPAVSPKTSRVDGRGGGASKAAKFNDDNPQQPHEWPADGKGSKLGGDDYSTPFGSRENPRTTGAGPAQTRANEAHNGQSTPKNDPLAGRTDVDGARKTLSEQPPKMSGQLRGKADEIVKPLASQKAPEDWAWNKNAAKPHTADDVKTLVAAEIHKNGGPEGPEGLKAGKDLARDLTVGKHEPSKPAVSPQSSRVDGRGGGASRAAKFDERPQEPHKWPSDDKGHTLRDQPPAESGRPEAGQTRGDDSPVPEQEPLKGQSDLQKAKDTLAGLSKEQRNEMSAAAKKLVKPLDRGPQGTSGRNDTGQPGYSRKDVEELVAAKIHENGPEAGQKLAKDLMGGKPGSAPKPGASSSPRPAAQSHDTPGPSGERPGSGAQRGQEQGSPKAREDVENAEKTLAGLSQDKRNELMAGAKKLIEPPGHDSQGTSKSETGQATLSHADVEKLVAAKIHESGPEAGEKLAKDLMGGKPGDATGTPGARPDGDARSATDHAPSGTDKSPSSKGGGDPYTPEKGSLKGRTDLDAARETLAGFRGDRARGVHRALKNTAKEIVQRATTGRGPKQWEWNKNNKGEPHTVEELETLVAADIHNNGPKAAEGLAQHLVGESPRPQGKPTAGRGSHSPEVRPGQAGKGKTGETASKSGSPTNGSGSHGGGGGGETGPGTRGTGKFAGGGRLIPNRNGEGSQTMLEQPKPKQDETPSTSTHQDEAVATDTASHTDDVPQTHTATDEHEHTSVATDSPEGPSLGGVRLHDESTSATSTHTETVTDETSAGTHGHSESPSVPSSATKAPPAAPGEHTEPTKAGGSPSETPTPTPVRGAGAETPKDTGGRSDETASPSSTSSGKSGNPSITGTTADPPKAGPSRAGGSSGGSRTTPNLAQSGTSTSSAQGARSGTGRVPEEPPRLEVNQDHQQVAVRTLEMIRTQYPHQFQGVVREAALIVEHLSRLPGAHRYGAQDLAIIQRQVAADIVWSGHRAAVNSARGFLGLLGEDVPPFDLPAREIFGQSRFNVERAEITLALTTGRDEFVAEATQILHEAAFAGAEVTDDQVLLVAAEIARAHRGSGYAHESGVRFTQKLISRLGSVVERPSPSQGAEGNQVSPEPLRLNISQDHQQVATRTIEMIRAQYPDQLGDVVYETGLIVWHLSRVPGAVRYSNEDLGLIQRQIVPDLVWGGHRAAVNTARGFFGLSAEDVPPFDLPVREIFGRSRFNVERAEISLALTAGRDEYVADAAQIIQETAFAGAEATEDEVLLVAAEIARGQRTSGTGHRDGVRFARTLTTRVGSVVGRSSQPRDAGTGLAPEEPPRLNVSPDHQQVATKTIEMIRAQFPDQLGDVAQEAGLIVWHLSRVPGAIRYGDEDLGLIQRQVVLDLVWGGHRAAVNSARGFLGLSAEDVPPFDLPVREIFGRSRFNVERAEISLALTAGRDEYVADAVRILEEMAFEGAEVGSESREVLLVAAEIARGQRSSGTGHESGGRLAHRLIGQVRRSDPDSQTHGGTSGAAGSGHESTGDDTAGRSAAETVPDDTSPLAPVAPEPPMPGGGVRPRGGAGTDIVDDWETESALSWRHPRSKDLGRIDEHLAAWRDGGRYAAIPLQEKEAQLDRILSAIDEWWESREGRPTKRYSAVLRLQERIRDERAAVRAQSAAPPATPVPSEPVHQAPLGWAELYARRLHDALSGDPVNSPAVVAVLRLVGRDADRVRELEDAFAALDTEDGPTTIASEMGQAVEDGRLSDELYESYLRLLGYVDVFTVEPVTDFRTAIPLEAAAPGSVVSEEEFPEVWDYARRVAQAVEGGRDDVAVELLRRLDRNERSLWLLAKVYRALTGRHLLEDLDAAADPDLDPDLAPLAHSVHPDDAEDYYRWLAESSFDHLSDGHLPIPAGHPEDGCILRAHLWVLQLRQWGVDARKVLALPAEGQSLVTYSANAFGATSDTPRPVNWERHIAPLIRVDPGNGDPAEDMVLDPALGLGTAVPVRQWLEAIGVRGDYWLTDADAADASIDDPVDRSLPQVVFGPAHANFVQGTGFSTEFPLELMDAVLRDQEDRLRDQSLEAGRRQEFRDWHAGLDPRAREEFNDYYGRLDDSDMHRFQEWFRSRGPGERQGFAAELGERAQARIEQGPAQGPSGPARNSPAPPPAAGTEAGSTRPDTSRIPPANLGVTPRGPRPRKPAASSTGGALSAGHDPTRTVTGEGASPLAPVGTEASTQPMSLREAVAARIGSGTDGAEGLLGPDPFGVRRPPAVPGFLAGFDYSRLHASRRAAFFRAIDLVRAGVPTAADLRPENLADGPVSEGVRASRNTSSLGFKTQKVPHLSVSIWLGGPLYDDGGSRTEFRDNIAVGKRRNSAFEHLILTDVPRAEFNAVRGVSEGDLSGRALQVRQMLNWAEQHGIRLINVDEVFNAGHWSDVLAAVRTERARGNPNGYAVASDLLRVLFLLLFGGVYSDGDNKVTGDIAQATAAAADSRHGLAIGKERRGSLVNAVLAAAAGSPGIKAYLDTLRANLAQPFSHLMAQAAGASDPTLLSPEDHTGLNQMNAVEAPADEAAGREAVAKPNTTMARETILRTGPNFPTFDRIARQLGLADRKELAHIPGGVYFVESSHSWIAPQAITTASTPADLDTLVNAVVGAVTSLHRETRTRPGGIYLPAAARTIDRLPAQQRQQAWEATLQTFRDTLQPGTHIEWISATNIELPPAIPQLINNLFPNITLVGLNLTTPPHSAAEGSESSASPLSPLVTEMPSTGPAPAADSFTDALATLLAQAPAQPRSHTWFDPASTRPVQSAFDVRRVEHNGERVTELTVAVHFTLEDGISDADVHDTWQRITAGVEEYFNLPEHRFARGDVAGDLLRLNVIPAQSSESAHLKVRLVHYKPGQLMTQRTWVTGQRPVFYAHEIAHQLGARDESRTTSRDYQLRRRGEDGNIIGITSHTISRTAANAGSLMGDFNAKPEGFQQVGLRQRHIDLFAILIGDITPYTGHAALREAVGARVRPNRDGLEGLLGADAFGVRRAPAVPGFLAGFDYSRLHASRRAAFFRAIDLVRPDAPARTDLRPENLAEGPVSEGVRVSRNTSSLGFKTQKVPHLSVSIWLGGPLYDDGGSRTEFRDNIAHGKSSNGGFEFIVLTDVSRAEFDAVRGVSAEELDGRPLRTLQMLSWAEQHGIRLINVDEVFNAEHHSDVLAAVRTERNRGNPNGYAVASDLLRVLFLLLFGGVYSDGDNKVTGNIAQATAAAADSRHGLAIGKERWGSLVNAVLAAAAGSPGIKAYLDMLRVNLAQPYSHLMITAQMPGADPSLLPPDAHADLNQANTVERPADEVAGQAAITKPETTMARETILRTGPNFPAFDRIAQNLGLSDRNALARIPDGIYFVESSHSWIPPQAVTTASPPADLDTLVDAVVGAVISLHRETRTRPGGIYLPAAARTIDRLPAQQRQQAWEATLQTFRDTLQPGTDIQWISATNTALPPALPQLINNLFPDTTLVGLNPATPGAAPQEDDSPPAPVETEAPVSGNGVSGPPPRYVENAPVYTPGPVPGYVDSPVSQEMAVALAAQLGLDLDQDPALLEIQAQLRLEQAAALLRYSWFDADRFALLHDQVGEVDAADLAQWVEGIGRIPDDIPQVAGELPLMDTREVYQVSQALGIDPAHLRLFNDDLEWLAGDEVDGVRRSTQPGFDVVTEVWDLLTTRYVPADEFADFVTTVLRADVTPEELLRALNAVNTQEDEPETPALLDEMDVEDLRDWVDAALRLHTGGSSRLTVEEAATRILNHAMPGDLTESQSGKVPDAWFAGARAQLEALLRRTDGGSDDREPWAVNRAQRLIDLRRSGLDDRAAGESAAGSSTSPGGRPAPTQEEIQAAADQLAPLTADHLIWVRDEFGIDPRDLPIFGTALSEFFTADDEPYVEVMELLDTYSAEHAAFAEIAARAELDADEMLLFLASVRHSEALALGDLRRMPAAHLTHLVQRELPSSRAIVSRLSPMSLADISWVSRAYRIDPNDLWIFGDALSEVFSHDNGDIRHLFARYPRDISGFADVAARAGVTAEDMAAVLPVLQLRNDGVTLRGLRTLTSAELRQVVNEELSTLREIATRLAPMSVADVSRVSHEHRIDPDHLSILDALPAIFSQAEAAGADPLVEVRQMVARFAEPHEIGMFAAIAARAEISAEAMRTVVRESGMSLAELQQLDAEDFNDLVRDAAEATRQAQDDLGILEGPIPEPIIDAGYQEMFEDARAALADLPEEEFTALMRQAGEINADYHRPLPVEMNEVTAEERVLHESVALLVAAQLYADRDMQDLEDPEEDARFLSNILARRLGTKRDTGGAPVGSSRPPEADPHQFGGESSRTTLDVRPPPATRDTGPVRTGTEDSSVRGSVPPVRPPLDTAPEPQVADEKPAPAHEGTDLVSLLRAAAMTLIADYLEAGRTPQVQLTEGVQRRLVSPERADDPLSRAVDALIASPDVQVLDADARLVSPVADDAKAAGSPSAEARFFIRASGTVSGPFEPAAAEGGAWHKSSWSRPEVPGAPVHCVEVTVIATAARTEW